MTKWIMGVAVVVVVGVAAWWYFGMPHGASNMVQQAAVATAPVGPDTSNQSIATDAASVKAQVAGIPTATSTSALPMQVAATQSAAGSLASLALKLSMRIGTMGTSSPLASSSSATLSDLNKQIADAHTQASAALGHIANATASGVSPATKKAEYAKATADMRVSSQDFTQALKDVASLMQALSIAPAASGTATTTSATGTQMGVVKLR